MNYADLSAESKAAFDAFLATLPAAPPVAVRWDSANRDAAITLSGDDAIASTVADGNPMSARVVSADLPAGRVVIELPCNYAGDVTNEEIYLAVVAGDYDSDNALPPYIKCDGFVGMVDLGIPVASGESRIIDLDQANGKGWFDNASNVYAADRAAGTNPHFTFTGPAKIAAEMWSATGQPTSCGIG